MPTRRPPAIQGVAIVNDMTKPFIEKVAEKLIQQLKEGVAPWQKPWQPGEPGAFLPVNPTTGKRYKGINAIHLMSQGHADQRWMTYKQAAGAGGQVRKGEKGTPIQYWKFSEEQIRTDADDKPILDSRGDPVKQLVQLERPALFFATVFNAEQIDGLPPLQARKEQEWSAVERAERILQASGAVIRHGEQDRAFYRPATDSIHLPDKGQFPTADNYYATALHELGHWTGHDSRLDRDLAHPFGSEGYAKEELRAEIASMILGEELGVGHDPKQHTAYVGSWIKALQDDPLEIFRAAADAEKIQGYVLGLEQKQILELVDEQQEGIDLQQADGLVRANQDLLADKVAGNVVAADIAKNQGDAPGLEAAADMKTIGVGPVRRPLPVDDALKLMEGEAAVAVARLDLITGGALSRENNARIFDAAAEKHLGFTLPHDWSGRTQVLGHAHENMDGQQRANSAESLGVEAQSWGVYAQYEAGMYQWLADFPVKQEAEKLAGRLALIDACSDANEYEKAAKLARVREDLVRRDPNSTAEDVSAAKEARKDAEFTAMKNDADLQRRIVEQERAPAAPAAAQQTGQPMPVAEKHFINVPFKEKDEAKALGAKWDRKEQSWYIPAGVDPAPFARLVHGTATTAPDTRQPGPAEQGEKSRRQSGKDRQFLAVPYCERMIAKAAGAEWDKAARSWYAGPGADMVKLERWKPENVRAQQGPAMTPKEEFGEALRLLGCVVTGDHPVMDGQKHRISVEGEKHSENAGSGFYVGHLDGHPAGYIKNNKTGIEMNWKSKGYSLGPGQKARMQAEAAAKREARGAEQTRRQERIAQRIARQMVDLVPALRPTPYMQAKGIEPRQGVFTDKDGLKTYIPAVDVNDKQWTIQVILEDGTKRFAKDGQKTGCFHVVGGMDALEKAPALVIGEGYATASSLSQSLGFATVAAFDSGNLPDVAKALHKRFPDKPVVVAGDDDRHLEATQGVNPGRTKALEAARATGGRVLLPIFAPGEYASNPKGFTDFNDLSSKSALGKDGIDRQVRSVVNSIIEKHHARLDQPEHAQQQEAQARRSLKIG
jgi:putative DNA primase/helicase